ncbi:MAG: hypothetical protein J5529_04445 [Prevotella sp.]|nr:hypothetical protein [Prevotella sp.]
MTHNQPIAIGQVIAAKSASRQEQKMQLSPLQRTEIDHFTHIFPTETELLAFFAPGKWEKALSNKRKCLCFGTVTLNVVKDYYGGNIARQMVKNNLVGLYTLARPNESINLHALDLTAGMFLGKFGNYLPVFGMLYYFASYLISFRSTYSSFDLQDVLRQCEQKFLPRWCEALGRLNETKDPDRGTKVTGRAAAIQYLRREYVNKGLDVRESALVRYGAVSMEDVAFIESGEEIAF